MANNPNAFSITNLEKTVLKICSFSGECVPGYSFNMYVLRGKAESLTKKYRIGDDRSVMTSGSGMDDELSIN